MLTQDIPMIGTKTPDQDLDGQRESASAPSKKPGLIVLRKINKTIEIKEKEHHEMREKFLKLIQKEKSQKAGQTPDPGDETANQNLRGNKDVSILSTAEWNTLVRIYRTDEHFDPLQVVSRERVRKSVLNGIPPNLRGEIWCMLCRCSREKAMHDEGIY